MLCVNRIINERWRTGSLKTGNINPIRDYKRARLAAAFPFSCRVGMRRSMTLFSGKPGIPLLYLLRAGAAAGGTGAFPPENGAKLQETLLKGPVPRT